MCGIAGILNLRGGAVDRSRVAKMAAVMAHRGPDDDGFFSDGSFSMCMRRLSIIDLGTGKQPISNEDDSVTVTFNGEIYNYTELAPRLEDKGHSFKTKSDTESLVHLYEEHGTDMLPKLNGMFAFAIWDSKARKLFIARDRLGIKPLYYTVKNNELVYGSELKCLAAAGAVDREVDEAALDCYLTTQYFPLDRTAYRNVKKLMPGHFMTVSGGDIRIEKYWDVNFPVEKSRISEGDAVDRFRELFKASVKRRLIADVPLGAFLSGGIDSSAVAAVMAGMMNEPVKTFSLGFGSEAREFDELEHVDIVVDYIKADASKWVVKPGDIRERFEKVMDHFDEPFGNGFHTFMVSEMTVKKVKVALSGIGADEMLGGYERQKKARLLGMYRNLPGAARGAVRMGAGALYKLPGARSLAEKALKLDRLSGSSEREVYFDWISVFDHATKERMYNPDFARVAATQPVADYVFEKFGDSVPKDFNDMISYLELKTTLADDFLNYTDRMSMAWSLEARTPFLDHTLVEFVATLPHEYKVKDGSTKYLLKKAMEGILPDSIINRKKQPFLMPMGMWFRDQLRPLVEDLVMRDNPACGEFLQPAAMKSLAQEHLANRADHSEKLWSLILLEHWCRKNIS